MESIYLIYNLVIQRTWPQAEPCRVLILSDPKVQRFFFCFFSQTLFVCMCKITCVCARVFLSLHVFGMGVFNQGWPFIITVFFFFKAPEHHQDCMRVRSMFARPIQRSVHVWMITKTGQNIWKSICRVQPELSSHWACRQKWIHSLWCERAVWNTSMPCWTELKSMYSWSSLQSWKKERKKEKLSSVCFAGSISGQNEANALGLYFFFLRMHPRWKAKSQSSKTNLIWICAGLSVCVFASVKCLQSAVCVCV